MNLLNRENQFKIDKLAKSVNLGIFAGSILKAAEDLSKCRNKKPQEESFETAYVCAAQIFLLSYAFLKRTVIIKTITKQNQNKILSKMLDDMLGMAGNVKDNNKTEGEGR